MAGKLYGVGVGPGDPMLMTLKAVSCIQQCKVLGIPAESKEQCTAYKIAQRVVEGIGEKEILPIAIPMSGREEDRKRAYGDGYRRIKEHLLLGKNVAFLNIGDPTLYGTYMEFHERIIQDGLQAEIISGVPAFCASAAALGIPIASREESIHIHPGCFMEKMEHLSDGTHIFMKSGKSLGRVKDILLEEERKRNYVSYTVTNCGMADEKLCCGMENLNGNEGYFTTVIAKQQRIQ